jgi:hypothetical protein
MRQHGEIACACRAIAAIERRKFNDLRLTREPGN